MTLAVAPNSYRTKAQLKAAIGLRLKYEETSIFGPEYPASGNGTVLVVGPSKDERKWFASVTLRDHWILCVK